MNLTPHVFNRRAAFKAAVLGGLGIAAGASEITGTGSAAGMRVPGTARTGTTSDPVTLEQLQADIENAKARAGVGTSVRWRKGVNSLGQGYEYMVVRAHTGGKVIPGLLSKRYAGNYEKQGTSGANFRPTGETLLTQYEREGGSLISNGSAWSTTTHEMRGAQIKDGVIYHNMKSTSTYPDCAAIGYRSDGSLKSYSALNGDTTASMVADGVIHSWSHGAPVVSGGALTDLSNPIWNLARDAGISARKILGQSATGDIIIINVFGKTGVEGIGFDECGTLAIQEGCHVAHMLDGGGSAQVLVNGVSAAPSSDDGWERAVGDFLILNAPINAEVVTGWVDIPLNSGYTTPTVFRVKMENNTIHLEGRVDGDFTASVVIGTLPHRFRYNGGRSKAFTLAGSTDVTRKLVLNADGTLSVVAGAATPYVFFDHVSFANGTPGAA